MPTEWFCEIDQNEFGPLTSGALRELATSGRLSGSDRVRKGRSGSWISAARVEGLFDAPTESSALPPPLPVRRPAPSPLEFGSPVAQGADLPGAPGLRNVRSIKDCISREEKGQRFGVIFLSLLAWLVLALLAVATWGTLLIAYVFGWAFRFLFAEYHVRKLQAIGTAATPDQFPEIAEALNQICAQFNVIEQPRVIVLNVKMLNAFALRIAQRRVIVLLSETLEGVLDQPAELRFFLGHELAHIMLDHSWRRIFELYKPAKFKAGRELTCDNCGVACAGDPRAAATALKRLGAGNVLHSRLSDAYLEEEADYLYSGINGWFLRQYLTYPPLGKRLANVKAFAARHGS
jgi:Zn-dependent protease with chaperone function